VSLTSECTIDGSRCRWGFWIFDFSPAFDGPDLYSTSSFMKRISVVEAMRALASISVALFHFCSQLYSTGAQLVTSYGWLGVDVFFVISGFVIPLSLYGRTYGLRDFPSFFLRRLVRLEPAYLVSIAAVVVLQYASSVALGLGAKCRTIHSRKLHLTCSTSFR
jgi:hypothetical protein